MGELTIPCPYPPSRSSIGGQMMTACPICLEVSGSTVIANHRPVVVRELIERLRGTEDYDLVRAELDHLRQQRQELREQVAELLDLVEDAATQNLIEEGDGRYGHAFMASNEELCDTLVAMRPERWEHTATGIRRRARPLDYVRCTTWRHEDQPAAGTALLHRQGSAEPSPVPYCDSCLDVFPDGVTIDRWS